MGMLLKLAVVLGFACSSNAFATNTEFFYENSSGSPIYKLLQSAKSSIDIEIYEIQDTRVHEEVLNAMNRGVKVRVIQEPLAVGVNCPIFDRVHADDEEDCRVQKRFAQKVIAKGGSYVPYAYDQFCPAEGQNRCLEHGKMILVDRRIALLSTGNFNPTSHCNASGLPKGETLTTCNRDYTILSYDQNVVNSLSSIFESDFKRHAYDLPAILKSKEAQKLTVSPYSLNPLLQFIRSAKKSIIVQNQYLKNMEMNNALIEAAQRGVNVFVNVNSICTFGRPDPDKDTAAIDQWKKTFKAFDKAGVKSRMFTKQIQINGLNGYLHSKAIVVDGARAWVGSVNGSTQALTQNREFGIFINDPSEVTKLTNYIVGDFNHPNTESWQESLNCKKD